MKQLSTYEIINVRRLYDKNEPQLFIQIMRGLKNWKYIVGFVFKSSHYLYK